MTIRELNRKKIYTADQLRSLSQFRGKYIDTYPLHYSYWNDERNAFETVYEIRGISSSVKENFQTVDEILTNHN